MHQHRSQLCDGTLSRLAAGLVLVGAALTAAAGIQSAGTYVLLGDYGANPALTPAVLQSWHLAGAEFGVGADLLVLTPGVFAAALSGRAVPAWLGWTGLAIGVAQLAPIGFVASLVFLLWTAIAGITPTTSTMNSHRTPHVRSHRDLHVRDPHLRLPRRGALHLNYRAAAPPTSRRQRLHGRSWLRQEQEELPRRNRSDDKPLDGHERLVPG